ncbi:MAG: hypothetical protein ACPG05_04115, partial [Bdellovibrionales bacterium]
MENLVFTPVQLISILGIAQALHALVYMAFRAGRLSRAGLAILYFFVLFCGFFYDLSYPFFEGVWKLEFDYSWLFWFFLPSLSYLLVLQVARLREVVSWRHYAVLFLPVIALFFSQYVFSDPDALYLMGLISGSVSLLLIWGNKSTLDGVWNDGKGGRARYWLIICLISVNVMFLAGTLFYLLGTLSSEAWVSLRNILGLGFVYLASTSLFRIYPQAVLMQERRRLDPTNQQNRLIIDRLARLLDVDRVYQEAQYGRKDLAKELNISEVLVSKIINDQYGETIPQLLNRYRVEEAKGLLKDTN